jgi:tetratricopeptide (TPR) repeat protein
LKIRILNYILISMLAACIQVACSQAASPPVTSPQGIAGAYDYARELYRTGNYEQSAIELERIALFTDTLDKQCYMLLSGCNDNLNKPGEAVMFLKKARGLEKDDSLKMEISFKIILLHMRHDEPIYALIELNSMHTGHSDYFTRKRLFFLVTCHFLLENYEQSEEYMHELADYLCAYDSIYASSLYGKALKYKSRKPGQYSIYSAILPGAGQFLTGEPQQGMDSFLLNAMLISLAVVTAERLTLLDSALCFFAMIKRYYSSNIRKAKVLALQKKEAKKIDLYNSLLDYIMSKM